MNVPFSLRGRRSSNSGVGVVSWAANEPPVMRFVKSMWEEKESMSVIRRARSNCE